MVFHGTRIVVTLELIFEVLHVLKVDCPDYPSHCHFSSISRDELASLFCEKAMLWGGTLNFSTTEFTKGPRILNMVMAFVLTPQSHCNTIIEPYACFLLSLMEGLSIDFPSHMIESIIDCYWDIATRDKLIFPLAITHILTHLHVTIPSSPLFYVMGAISKEYIWRSATQLAAKQPRMEPSDAAPSSRPSSSFAPSSSFKATSPLLTSWSSFSTCVLILVVILTIYLIRCVRWTSESIASLVASLALVVLHPHLHLSMLRSPLLQTVEMMMVMMLLALSMMMRWRPLSDTPFVTREKNEE